MKKIFIQKCTDSPKMRNNSGKKDPLSHVTLICYIALVSTLIFDAPFFVTILIGISYLIYFIYYIINLSQTYKNK